MNPVVTSGLNKKIYEDVLLPLSEICELGAQEETLPWELLITSDGEIGPEGLHSWLGASFSQSAIYGSSDWPQTNILLDWSRCSRYVKRSISVYGNGLTKRSEEASIWSGSERLYKESRLPLTQRMNSPFQWMEELSFNLFFISSLLDDSIWIWVWFFHFWKRFLVL